MNKHIEEEHRKWCEKIPKPMQTVYLRAIQGHSLRAAVNARCQDCTNWQRIEIRECLAVTCPLWEYRLYRIDSGANTPPSTGFHI